MKKIISVSWYQKVQWERLREISSDKENFKKSYEQMLSETESKCKQIEKMGITPIKVDVDVNELLRWCNFNKLLVNAETRSKYTMEQLNEMILDGKIDVL